MRAAYRKLADNKIELVRFWGDSPVVEVPGKIAGCTVASVAPYAFSAYREELEADLIFCGEEEAEGGVFAREETLRCGGNIREIHLPSEVEAIGNYAFYGCMEMKVFHGTDRILRMGSGVFTGCRLSRVQIDFYDGAKSCLKEILTEIRYGITATLVYGGVPAKVVFPEYYADAVENTPARIVETHYYGSGGDYRECFYRRELDFGKYDGMFALSAARDQGEVTACVALARLLYPLHLDGKAADRYAAYVREHGEEILRYAAARLEEGKDFAIGGVLQVIGFCCREGYFDRQALETGITLAGETGQTELLSILMDERHKRFPKKKKEFIL